MIHLIAQTISDLHCGRMTWRVIALLAIPTTGASLIASML